MGKLDQIYQKLPLLGQNAAVTVFGIYWHWLRFGPGYRQAVAGYVERERYPKAAWQIWQEERLKGLLRLASEHVPYYRDSWTNQEKAAARVGRWEALPLLGKDPLRSNPWSFVRNDIAVSKPLVFHTSGSTGTPIASIWTTKELRNSLALREVRS